MSSLVEISGIDGSGKTTVCNELIKKLKRSNYDASIFETHNSDPLFWEAYFNLYPRNKPVPRNILNFELSYLASRTLPSLLQSNDIVLADRYTLDKVVYATLRGDNETASALDGLKKADFTALLDLSPKIANERIENRGEARDWKETPEVLRQAREVYHQVFATIQQDKLMVDAEAPLNDIVETIYGQIT